MRTRSADLLHLRAIEGVEVGIVTIGGRPDVRRHRALQRRRAVSLAGMCKLPASSSDGATQIRNTRTGVRNGIAPAFISGNAGRGDAVANVAVSATASRAALSPSPRSLSVSMSLVQSSPSVSS
jgi:hypothetical protein